MVTVFLHANSSLKKMKQQEFVHVFINIKVHQSMQLILCLVLLMLFLIHMDVIAIRQGFILIVNTHFHVFQVLHHLFSLP